MHAEVLPPEAYYDRLGTILMERFPGADPDLVDHVVSLAAAFDTAAAFAISFGINKFQLAQAWVKLVGEIVGRDGRKPNPELVKAIKKWPPIENLKMLQEFLGTANYARPHAGPAYARLAAPLRPLLKPNASWPMDASQLAAIEALKGALEESHVLQVPDEAAAIEAASAWLAGLPPAGRAYELGADGCGYAVGGVFGQANASTKVLGVLMYFSAHLSETQQKWHPYRQEFYALLCTNREAVKHSGRIPRILHTDHATIVRQSDLPLGRIDPMEIRWMTELKQGGSLLLYLSLIHI